jgi:hypothetical protein
MCEAQTCGADVANPSQVQMHNLAAATLCFKSTDTASAGPGKGMPRTQLCQAVLACVHRTACNTINDTDCWCGINVDPSLCFTPSYVRNGPCKAEIDAASESSMANDTEDRYTDYSYPVGAAFFLIDNCDSIQHPRPGQLGPCQAICSGMTGAAGAGGSAGASGAGGAGSGSSGSGGSSGAPGSAGTGGSAGTAGASGTTGAGGTSSAGGTTGTAGVAGAAGATGLAGAGGDSGQAGAAAGAGGNGGAAGGADAAAGTSGDAGGGGAGTGGGTGGPGDFPFPTTAQACAAPAAGASCPDLDGDGMLDCSQTAVMNPGFDTGIASWIGETPFDLPLTWNMKGDLNGKKTSGALVVTSNIVADAAGWTIQGAFQCVPVTGAAVYDLAAQLSMPTDPSSAGGAILGFFFYPTADCTGPPNASALSNGATAQNMCEVLTLSEAAPASAQSVAVRLAVVKPFRQASQAVTFDNVLFRKH